MRLALVALLALGCSAAPYELTAHPPGPHRPDRFYLDPHGAVTLDPAFTPDERESILEGFDGWTEASAGRVAINVLPTGGFLFQRVDRAPDSNGRTQWTLGIQAVWLDPGRTGPAAARTAAHELGHIMGLDHYDVDDSCIMFPSNTGRLEFCQHDVTAICRVWGCP